MYKSFLFFAQPHIFARTFGVLIFLGACSVVTITSFVVAQSQSESEIRSEIQFQSVSHQHKPQSIAIIQQHTLVSIRSIPIAPPQPVALTATSKPNPKPSPKPQPVRTKIQAQERDVNSYFIRPTTGRVSQWIHGNNAIDVANECGTPVVASADGTISSAVYNSRWNAGYGNYVSISHPNGTQTLYAHLQHVAVAQDQYVLQGSVVGLIGSTGLSTGCHLHFEVHGAKNFVR